MKKYVYGFILGLGLWVPHFGNPALVQADCWGGGLGPVAWLILLIGIPIALILVTLFQIIMLPPIIIMAFFSAIADLYKGEESKPEPQAYEMPELRPSEEAESSFLSGIRQWVSAKAGSGED